jgi:lysophospholipase L1-like esterase
MPARRLALLVPLLLLALALELGLRAFHQRTLARVRARNPSRPLCTRPAADPALIYEVIPGRCGANSRGFLDQEHAVPAPAGVARLVVIGDSVAQGEGVGLQHAFPRLLGELLNAGQPEPRVEVVLLARAGYSTSQQLRLLETETARYQPAVVLWSYVLNDPAHPVYHNPNGELGLYHYAPRSHLAHFAATRLFLLRESWRARSCRAEYHALLHCAYSGEVAASLARIGAWSRANETPVVFAIHPVFEEHGRFESYSLSGLHSLLADLARRAGLRPVDLVEAYLGEDPEALKLPDPPGWHDAWHPNAEGHRRVAAFLVPRLREAGIQDRLAASGPFERRPVPADARLAAVRRRAGRTPSGGTPR